MSFLFRNDSRLPPAQPAPGNIQARNVDTNAESQPVPYFAGTARLALTWLSPVYHPKASPITVRTGKDSTSTVGYNYSGDLAGLVAHGPVDAIKEIWLDQTMIWSGNVTRAAGTDYADISTSLVQVRIPWGTETQAIDTLLLSGFGHPAYRGQCTPIFRKFHFGQNRTAVPNVEMVLFRKPVVPWLGDGAIGIDANPAHVAVELTTNARYGFGLRQGIWNPSRMIEFAQWCRDQGLGLSPVLTQRMSFTQFLATLLGYFDGLLEYPDGQFSIKSAQIPQDYETAPVIELDDMTETPKVGSAAYARAYNETRFSWTAPAEGYKQMPALAFDTGAQTLLGRLTPQDLERSWVTQQALANTLNARACRLAALPTVPQKLKLRELSADRLRVGKAFLFRPYLTAPFLMRAICKNKGHADPLTREVEVTWVQDLSGVTPTNYTPDDVTRPEPDEFGPEPATQLRALELPLPLKVPGATALSLGMIVARPHALISGASLYRSLDDLEYIWLAVFNRFAIAGTLAADLDNANDTFTLAVDDVDLLSLVTQTAAEADDNAWLLIVGDEIMSIETVTLLGGGNVEFSGVRRARYDTVPADHAEDDLALIIPRAFLPAFTHSTFAGGQTSWLKAAMQTLGGEEALDTPTALEVDFAGREALPLPPAALLVNGMATNPTNTSGTTAAIAWSLKSWADLGFPSVSFYAAASLAVKLEILDAAGTTVKRTENLGAGTTAYNYTAVNRLADFSGVEPAAFQVRVHTKLGTAFSLFAPQLIITKV